MEKKKLTYIILGIIALLALTGGVLLAFVLPGTQKTEPTPTPEPNNTSSIDSPNVDLLETEQFKEGQKDGNFLINSTIVDAHEGELTPLMAWTARKYTENAFLNPYFITNYWANKDDYKVDALNKYIFPYLGETKKAELNQWFTDQNWEAFSQVMYTAEDKYTVLPNCFDSWDKYYCFAGEEPTITNMTFESLGGGQFKVVASFTTNVVYQKPDGLEGDSITQKRNYAVEYTLSQNKNVDLNDPKQPIMIIDNIYIQSLEITDTDYIVNQSE